MTASRQATRTATCAVHLLLGALPIEAELHKRRLSLLYNIMVSTNETITELTKCQIAIMETSPYKSNPRFAPNI